MAQTLPFQSDDPRELGVCRLIAAARATVWRCWTEPDLHKRWYCPPPWYVSEIAYDLRAGGASRVVMNGPQGERNVWPGQFLEVIAGERLVFTDAFCGDWRPAQGAPFMVGVVSLADAPGGTRMTWSARHWRLEDRDAHVDMNFEQGWGICCEQLETLAQALERGEPL